MRFTDGAWRIIEGFEIHSAKEVRFIDVTEEMVKLTVPTFYIGFKGATLSGPYITLEITSPADNVWREYP